jgi:hypothetical protein
VLHGLRANFITQLVQHRVPRNGIQQLVGHEPGELIYDTYSLGVPLEQLAEVVALLDYGDAVAAAITRAMQEEPTNKAVKRETATARIG